MRFWIPDYLAMLERLRKGGRRLLPLAEYFRSPGEDVVLLRHDVDRLAGRALQLAEAEHGGGVRASYYLRCTRAGVFPLEVARQMVALGHEVGYHYEDLSRCRGDRKAAWQSFRRNLKTLRRVVPCVTVSMHGSPLSPYDNRTLLEGVDLAAWGLSGDASLPGRGRFVYFTDAGGAWNSGLVNRRDRLGEMPPENPLQAARLDRIAESFRGRPLYFNLHPERWAATRPQWIQALAADELALVAKSLARWVGR